MLKDHIPQLASKCSRQPPETSKGGKSQNIVLQGSFSELETSNQSFRPPLNAPLSQSAFQPEVFSPLQHTLPVFTINGERFKDHPSSCAIVGWLHPPLVRTMWRDKSGRSVRQAFSDRQDSPHDWASLRPPTNPTKSNLNFQILVPMKIKFLARGRNFPQISRGLLHLRPECGRED